MLNKGKRTARSRLVITLAEEILSRSTEGTFAIASEHQLCRRFNISRVTVRLALSDLEARGLIFRRHGKGTFAYGQLNRVHRAIGIFLKRIPDAKQWVIAEMIRGFQSGAAALRTNVLLIHTSPQEWSSEMMRNLEGVLVFPGGVTLMEVQCFEHMRMPTLFAWETDLPGRFIDFKQAETARMMSERLFLGGHEHIALVTGFEKGLDALKKEGVCEALKSVGKRAEQLMEYSIGEDANDVFAGLVRHVPHFSAVIATDDEIAFRFIEYLHSRTAIRVPDTMSVASFHRSPYLATYQPPLSTVEFDFFDAGKRAVEALYRASQTADSLDTIKVPGRLVAGGTISRRLFSSQRAKERSSA